MDQEEFKSLIDVLSQNIRLLEQSIIKTVVESKAENELILRELTGYLNSTANEVRQLNNIINQIATSTSLINNSVAKIDEIENRTIEMPHKLLELQNKISSNVSSSAEKLTNNDSKLMQGLGMVNKKTEMNRSEIIAMKSEIEKFSVLLTSIYDTIEKNQENTNNIIKKLVDGNLDIAKIKTASEDERRQIEAAGNISLKEAKVDLEKTKVESRNKVVLAILGSGGALYILIDLFTKLFLSP